MESFPPISMSVDADKCIHLLPASQAPTPGSDIFWPNAPVYCRIIVKASDRQDDTTGSHPMASLNPVCRSDKSKSSELQT
jgi:hypothetical protein